jgi:hypothetical protein
VIRFSAFGRKSERDVEAGGQLADARLFDRREIDNYRFAGFEVTNAIEDRVAFVARVSLDITLRREFLPPFHFNDEMDVRRAAGVANGLDGAEQIFARRAGQETSETLEGRVCLG